MYKLPAIILLCVQFFSPNGYAQNLFANSGFEDMNLCAENNTPCCVEAWFNIPATIYSPYKQFDKKPVSGRNFLVVPIENVRTGYSQKRCVYSMLACPLKKGERYLLTFYIAATERIFERLEFYFTDTEPTLKNIDELGRAPSFRITERNIDAAYNMDWNHVRYEFTATGNSRFCIIGNFTPMRNPHAVKDAMSAAGDIYYFVDQLSLKPLSDTVLCPGYAANIGKIYAQNYRHATMLLF